MHICALTVTCTVHLIGMGCYKVRLGENIKKNGKCITNELCSTFSISRALEDSSDACAIRHSMWTMKKSSTKANDPEVCNSRSHGELAVQLVLLATNLASQMS